MPHPLHHDLIAPLPGRTSAKAHECNWPEDSFTAQLSAAVAALAVLAASAAARGIFGRLTPD